VSGFGAEAARPPPSAAPPRDRRPTSAAGRRFADESVGPLSGTAAETLHLSLFGAAGEAMPRSASKIRFAAESVGPLVLGSAAGDESLCSASARRTRSRTAVDLAPPYSASECRVGAEGQGPPS
jgi:hypothetical protein